MISLSLKFLDNLYKYGKVINTKQLTRKIKDYLLSESLKINLYCETKIQSIILSLQKYSKNDLFNKTQSKFTNLMENELNEKSNLHLIIFNLIKFVQENCLSDFDQEEIVTLKFLVFQNFIKYIRKDEFVVNTKAKQNIEILKFFLENYSNFKKILSDHYISLNDILEKIILNKISIQIIDINYLSLYSNFLKKENSFHLQIFNKILTLFEKQSLKSVSVLTLIDFCLGFVTDVHNILT